MRRRLATPFFVFALLSAGFTQPLVPAASASTGPAAPAAAERVAPSFLAGGFSAAKVGIQGVPALKSAPNVEGLTKPDTSTADSKVTELAASASAHGAKAALAQAGKLGLTVDKGKVRLIVEASDLALAKQSIAAKGVQIEGTAGNLIQILVAPDQLDGVIAAAGVNWVRPPLAHTLEAVTDEPVKTTGAFNWQLGGHDGTGVKVAIIDGGFTGLAAAQSSGDLPASLTTQDDCSGNFDTATEHGTAVAQVVYKMAPGAQLYLICVDTEVDLANAEVYAKAQGVQIINHSMAWFNSSKGDGSGAAGTPDWTVKDANNNGILWVNAAGNSAQQHWSGTFVSDGTPTHPWNVFAAGGVIGNGFYVPNGASTCVFLKWNNWPGTAQDYDLFLVDINDNVYGYSVNTQTGSQPPTEQTCMTNDSGSSQWFYVLIRRWKATTAPRFDLYVWYTDFQFQVPAGSINEPASSPSAFAVGAVCWSGTTIEPYSSQGPNIGGVVKPDMSGPDQNSSSVYGAYSSCSPQSGFAGTSSASSHVAGAAADVKSANPTFTAAQIKTYLQSNSTDLGVAGKDNLFGSGYLNLPAPGVPTTVTAVGYNESAGVFWHAPATGVAPTGYTATASPGGAHCSTTGALSCTVETLTNGTPYTFTVVATTAMATSDPSDPASATPVAVPDAPTNVAGVALATSVVLTWGAPDDNGSSITGYDVAVTPGGPSCSTTALTCTFTGLTTHTAYMFAVTATNGNGTGPAGSVVVAPRIGDSFVPLTPNRVVSGISVTSKSHATFQVTGLLAGDATRNVPANATAVTGILSEANATAAGWLALVPEPSDTSLTSTINFLAHDARATGVTVPLGSDGTLSVIYGAVAGKTVAATFDVTGYFVAGTSGSTYFSLTPNRLVDSRTATKTGILTGQLVAGTPKSFVVTGRTPTDVTKNVPAHAVAVTGTLTVVNQTAAGFLTLGPDPLNAPPTASLFFPKGDIRAAGLTVKLAADGTLSVTFTSLASAKADVIFDVNGYFLPGESGAMYVPVTPNRLLDSRPLYKIGLTVAFKSHVAGTFQVTGRVPSDATRNVPAGAVAVTGILTVAVQSAAGWLSLTPLPNNYPTTSTLNFPLGDIRATGVTVPISSAGKLSVTYGAVAGATTHAIFDVSGYFLN
jgi:hypothetical protein